ncbi:heme-copper oxidase subunit III [Candidatus Sumerlaeota bacterium]|nr:heme-copper oxidase subunit III [Candidatus Sumerlaeota bacterium]
MSVAEIKHIVEPHPVTGINNGKFGTWLFLTSEVMLFGGLFSAYILLRTGADEWLPGYEMGLSTPIGFVNTLILIASSVTIVFAWHSLKTNHFDNYKKFMGITILLALAFFVIKILFEYLPKFHHHHYPSTNTYYAIYFTITGLHALHVLGGVVVNTYFLFPGAAMWRTEPERFTGRIECAGLYWHFVDLVWIFAFPVLYLL